jgi:hypothetical protein
MAKVPAFTKIFAGRWRISRVDTCDNDFLAWSITTVLRR